MEITPAILTNSTEDFKKKLERFRDFMTLDIDICLPPFTADVTLQIEEVIPMLNFANQSIGFHFMVEEPEVELQKLMRFGPNVKARIYLHQESDLGFLESNQWLASLKGETKSSKETGWPSMLEKCLVIKSSSDIWSLDFYNKFSEIQIMTVEIGRQGSSFLAKELEKVKNLRELGYTGKISLDGAINLQTAEFIKGSLVDRVSVGSYFNQDEDPMILKQKLEEALTLQK